MRFNLLISVDETSNWSVLLKSECSSKFKKMATAQILENEQKSVRFRDCQAGRSTITLNFVALPVQIDTKDRKFGEVDLGHEWVVKIKEISITPLVKMVMVKKDQHCSNAMNIDRELFQKKIP